MGKEFEFKTTEWIAWLAATGAACVSLVSFAYSTFSTKEDAISAAARVEMRIESDKRDIEKRLDRIENKLDGLNERLSE